MAKRVTHKTVGEAVVNRQRFEGPSSRGGTPSEVGSSTGRLSAGEAETMKKHNPSYVVKSYDTPVAWHSEEHGWHVPADKHSPTTSRLQNNIRRSLSGHFTAGHQGARQ